MNIYRIRARLIRKGEIYDTRIDIVWETTAVDLAAATEKGAAYIRMAEREERAECVIMNVEVQDA